MARKVQILTNVETNESPKTLSIGEPAFNTKTKKLYIGDGENNPIEVIGDYKKYEIIVETPISDSVSSEYGKANVKVSNFKDELLDSSKYRWSFMRYDHNRWRVQLFSYKNEDVPLKKVCGAITEDFIVDLFDVSDFNIMYHKIYDESNNPPKFLGYRTQKELCEHYMIMDSFTHNYKGYPQFKFTTGKTYKKIGIALFKKDSSGSWRIASNIASWNFRAGLVDYNLKKPHVYMFAECKIELDN